MQSLPAVPSAGRLLADLPSRMDRPHLVYDDDCTFCTCSANFVVRHAPVKLVPFSAVDSELTDRLPAEWESCAHLLTAETTYSCGSAMTRAYELTDLPGSGLFPVLRQIPGWATIRETGYRLLAAHRERLGFLCRFAGQA